MATENTPKQQQHTKQAGTCCYITSSVADRSQQSPRPPLGAPRSSSAPPSRTRSWRSWRSWRGWSRLAQHHRPVRQGCTANRGSRQYGTQCMFIYVLGFWQVGAGPRADGVGAALLSIIALYGRSVRQGCTAVRRRRVHGNHHATGLCTFAEGTQRPGGLVTTGNRPCVLSSMWSRMPQYRKHASSRAGEMTGLPAKSLRGSYSTLNTLPSPALLYLATICLLFLFAFVRIRLTCLHPAPHPLHAAFPLFASAPPRVHTCAHSLPPRCTCPAPPPTHAMSRRTQ